MNGKKEIHTMATLAQIEGLEARRAKIAQALAKAKKSLNDADRTAEKHVKLALGGAVIAVLENLPVTVRHAILTRADQGIQKQGLGREKFEALKARFKKTEEQK